MFIRASARMSMRSFSNIHSGSRLVVRSFGSARLSGAALHQLFRTDARQITSRFLMVSYANRPTR